MQRRVSNDKQSKIKPGDYHSETMARADQDFTLNECVNEAYMSVYE